MQQNHRLLTGALACLALAAGAATAHAAAFTAGDLVIYRVGSGSGSLVNTGSAVFLDEYTPAGALVQSIALPTAAAGANFPLIASGTATSEGLLSRSADGQYLIATGYGRAIGGTGSLAGTAAATVPRVVGRIAFDGSVDTTTALTDYADGNNPRSATSNDGSAFWVTGGAGGVRYAPFASTTSTQLSTTQANLRQASIFAGQLYVDTGSGTSKTIGSVGSGLPTTSGQTITFLSGTPLTGSPYGFALLDLDAGTPGVDTLYIADDSAGLQKFSLVGGSWTSNGTVGSAADTYRGLSAVVNGNSVTLYAVRKGGGGAAGGGELVAITDASGYNGAFSGTPTLLATAAANTAFRGIALAPAAIAVTPPSINGFSNAFSAVLGDTTDFAATQGLTFNVSDSSMPACSIQVAASSSDQNVVPDANLGLSACNNGNYTLKITPLAAGFADITLDATNAGHASASATLHFAVSAPWAAPGALATVWPLGAADASTAQAIDAYTTIIGFDEDQVLRVDSRTDSGPASAAFDVSPSLALDPSDTEVDIEASARDPNVPNRIYWSSSHGNSKKGNLKPNRNRIFATDLNTSTVGSITTVNSVTVLGFYEHLRDDLIAWDQANGHGLGANYLGFAASAAAGVPPKIADGSGFNIEGLAVSPDGSQMWLGFRAPLLPTSARTHALLVPVLNFASLAQGVLGHAPGQAVFGAPVFLDLGGRGVREIQCAGYGCLIEAGAVDGTPNAALYTWSGNPADAPVLRSGNVTGLNPEGVVELPAGGFADDSVLEIISDDGGVDLYGTGVDAKDLPYAEWKKYRLDYVALGARAPAYVSIVGATSQSALVANTFASPLQVSVADTNHAPIAGARVTFTAPAAGASATFVANSTNTQIVLTDASGVATSSTLSANAIPGNYSVSAAVSGTPGASFALSNLAPQAVFAVSALDFGTVRYEHSGTQSIDITNSGTADLHIAQATADGDFSITASDCATAVAPNAHCTLTLAFTPNALGARTGTLAISSDSHGDPGTVALSGTGAAAQAALALTLDDGQGIVQPGQALTYILSVGNAGPDRAPQVTLSDVFPAELSACSWTSSASGGAGGNTAGPATSAIGDRLDLPSGAGVTYTINCTVAAGAAAGSLTHGATLASDALVDNTGAASAHDDDRIVTDLIFRDGFDH